MPAVNGVASDPRWGRTETEWHTGMNTYLLSRQSCQAKGSGNRIPFPEINSLIFDYFECKWWANKRSGKIGLHRENGFKVNYYNNCGIDALTCTTYF